MLVPLTSFARKLTRELLLATFSVCFVVTTVILGVHLLVITLGALGQLSLLFSP